MKNLVFIVLVCCFGSAVASDDGGKKGSCASGSCGHSSTESCSKLLEKGPGKSGPGPISFFPSGRSPKTDSLYLEAAERFAKVAYDLGYHVPPHQIIMAPSKELVGMVPVGGYAAPSFIDGQKIVEDGPSSSGVMEFVVDGCPTCRSFNRDTTDLIQQKSINAHVIGHNDFGKASYFQQSRVEADPVAAKYELSQLMRQLYSTYDHDEVSMFYQLLQSLNGIQDYARGSYVDPAKLSMSAGRKSSVSRIMAKRKIGEAQPFEAIYGTRKFPASPTASALQAYVSNMPQEAADWERQMAVLFEQAQNMFPTVVQQKIANEGWATFSQYLIPKHAHQDNDSTHIFGYADLLKGVAGNGIALTNPYWLGLECWINIYTKFRTRPEIVKIENELEKDKKFVAYAHTLMATLDDYSFIRKALDEQWVRKHQLHLKREATYEELAKKGIQVDPFSEDTYDVVLSISGQRIVDAIARGVGEKKKYFPRIHLVNMNHRGREILYGHEPFENLPLERFSAAQTVFVLSFMQKKPVSLDTIGSSAWLKYETINQKIKKQLNSPDRDEDIPIFNDYELFTSQIATKVLVDMHIRITAFPDGTIKVYELPDTELSALLHSSADQFGGLDNIKIEEEWLNQELTQQLQGAVDYYKNDLLKSTNSDHADAIDDGMREIVWSKEWVSKIIAGITKTTPMMSTSMKDEGITDAGATAADAILEYKKMLNVRVARALQDALQGNAKYSMGKTGVKLRALPMIPQFQHDSGIAGMLNRQKVPGPIDDRYDQNYSFAVGVDDLSDMGIGQGLPGDITKRPPQEQGEGEGEGEGEAEEAEEGEGDPSDQEADDIQEGGGNDPSIVEIPMELWAEVLNSQLELPNPRSTVGGMKVKDFERGGVRTKDGDPVDWDETIKQAISWGAANNPDALKPVKGESAADRMKRVKKLMIDGLKVLPAQEYKIRSWEPTMEPDYKAVVVFVIDLSGSMQGEPLKKSKEFVYNIVSFLRSKYPQVELRFVGYDTEAYEIPEDKVFNTQLGGATDDSVGYIMANKILGEYNPREYNMYVYGTGDGGSDKIAETIEQMESIYKKTQHMGFVENQLGWTASPELLEAIKSLSEKYGWFDYGIIDQDQGSVLKSLYEFFGKGKNEGRK